VAAPEPPRVSGPGVPPARATDREGLAA
jgi:hypothetical protein